MAKRISKYEKPEHTFSPRQSEVLDLIWDALLNNPAESVREIIERIYDATGEEFETYVINNSLTFLRKNCAQAGWIVPHVARGYQERFFIVLVNSKGRVEVPIAAGELLLRGEVTTLKDTKTRLEHASRGGMAYSTNPDIGKLESGIQAKNAEDLATLAKRGDRIGTHIAKQLEAA